MKYTTYVHIMSALFLLGCSPTAPIPSNVVREEHGVATQLAALAARIRTNADGHVTEVSFYYDPDANNPTVGNSDIACLASFPELETLDLGHTEVTNAGLRVLPALRKLRSLTLPRTITDDGIATISQIVSLSDLNVWACPITDEGLAHLKNSSGIERLEISHTQITGKYLRYLSGMKRLRCLLLDSTAVAKGGIDALNDLPTLRVLSLGWTGITDRDLEDILPTLARLEVLSLQSTRITDRGLTVIENASRLKVISVIESQVTDEGIKRLGTSLPNCKINKAWVRG